MRCKKCGYTLIENKRILNKCPYCLTRRISDYYNTPKRVKLSPPIDVKGNFVVASWTPGEFELCTYNEKGKLK